MFDDKVVNFCYVMGNPYIFEGLDSTIQIISCFLKSRFTNLVSDYTFRIIFSPTLGKDESETRWHLVFFLLCLYFIIRKTTIQEGYFSKEKIGRGRIP